MASPHADGSRRGGGEDGVEGGGLRETISKKGAAMFPQLVTARPKQKPHFVIVLLYCELAFYHLAKSILESKSCTEVKSSVLQETSSLACRARFTNCFSAIKTSA
jgi:hypothetical protein